MASPSADSLRHYQFSPASSSVAGPTPQQADPTSDGVTSPQSANTNGITDPATSGGRRHHLSHPTIWPLSGIKVIIIHVKDTFKDGPHVSENILTQLREHDARLCEEGQGLGCEFIISESGASYWF
jgi:hypothetical protein